MANVFTTYTPGLTLYFVSFATNGKIFSVPLNTYVTPNSADWDDYAVPLTETSSGSYEGTFPAASPAGFYYINGYQQAGGSPAFSDEVVLAGTFTWNGTGEVIGGGTCISDSISVGVFTADAPTITAYVDSDSDTITITPGVQ